MGYAGVGRTDAPYRHAGNRDTVTPPLLRFLTLSLVLCVMLASGQVSSTVAQVLPHRVALGAWVDVTSTFFSTADTPFVLNSGTREDAPAPPLQVLALVDWRSRRRTGLLSTWPNQSSLTLWENLNDVTPASRIISSDLVYRAAWSTAPLSAKSVTGGTFSVTELRVVSAIGADLLGVGELDVVVQASDGSIWALNHSSAGSASSSPSSRPTLEPIIIISANTAASRDTANTVKAAEEVSLQFKIPSGPQLAVVPDFLCSQSNFHVAQSALAFVNVHDQLVLLSRVANTTSSSTSEWPPSYVARVLADESSDTTHRVVLPFSIVMEDVNEDCAAELLYAVRDSQAQLYEIYMLNPNEVTTFSPTGSAAASASASSHRVLQLEESAGERYGDAFTLADVNGDGLPELLLPVQLAHGRSSCAASDTRNDAEVCTPYHAIRVFYPIRAASARGPPSCSSSSQSDERHLQYKLSQSELVVLTEEWCDVADWNDSREPVLDNRLSLYMPSYPSAPLVLRPGDYNRDRLVDLLIPSSFGPIVLTSRVVKGAWSMLCTPLDASTGRKAVRQTNVIRRFMSFSTAGRESYRTATPFFSTLAQLGRLEVVLTHHGRYAINATERGAAVTAVDAATKALQVYQNAGLPSRSYSLSAAAITGVAYGAACVGATHHMTWQDIHMRSHWATVTQLGRTQGHALLSSHVLIGLDETFSYVHGYTVGLRVTRQAGDGGSLSHVRGLNRTVLTQTLQRREWPSYLVPNAAVFVQLTPVNKPKGWRLEMYLPTSSYRVLLIIAVTVGLIVIGLPAVWLRCTEMQEDYREWRTPL